MVQSALEFNLDAKHTYPEITDEQVQFYRENGYLIVENAMSKEEVEELRRETISICRNDNGQMRNGRTHTADETDDEVIAKYLCIHFPHKVSEIMTRYLAHPTIVDVLTRVIGPNVKCMQSMLFIKAAGKPGQAWHQDEDYIPTRDRSLTGGWMALDDATLENGCLWLIPGSNRPGVLWPQAPQNDERFDCTEESYGFPYKDSDAIPVEVKAGAIVFFNGYTLHRSFANNAKTGYRRVLVNHYMSAESLLPWLGFKEGMALAKADYRDIVMIAGKDPYAYKGVEDRARPSVRPTKQGGCVW